MVFFIVNKAVWIHLSVIFYNLLQISKQSVLELDGLTNILIIYNAFNAVTEVRRTDIISIVNRLAFELNWQLHLTRAPCCNLKKNHAKCKTVSRSSCLEELNIDITLIVRLVTFAILGKALNL